MDESFTQDLEFFDLSNASDEEIKHIRQILSDSGSNGCVELPWEVPLAESFTERLVLCPNDKSAEEETPLSLPVSVNSIGSVVGQALLYAPPPVIPPPPLPPLPQATRLPLHHNADVLSTVETYVPQVPPMSNASPMGTPYLPGSYHLVPRTLPYLRAYPHHVGMPLLTYTLPASGDLTHHVPSHYSQFLPLAAPVPPVMAPPHLDKPLDTGEMGEGHPKGKGPSDMRQYGRRGRKKNQGSHYASPPDYGSHSLDNYRERGEDPSLVSGAERLTAVPSTLPLVPVPMPQSAFSMTSGTLPMHSYPPGLHPLQYSQISGPQAQTTPLYYVPMFNPPAYSSYIPSASAHMIMPVGVAGSTPVHPASESECSVGMNESVDDITKSSDSPAASSESMDGESGTPKVTKCTEIAETPTADVVTNQETLDDSIVDNESEDSPNLSNNDNKIETNALPNLVSNAKEEKLGRNVMHKLYSESSPSWADLFRKQCPQVNGLDRRPIKATSVEKSSDLDKEINGKVYTVPNSDGEL